MLLAFSLLGFSAVPPTLAQKCRTPPPCSVCLTTASISREAPFSPRRLRASGLWKFLPPVSGVRTAGDFRNGCTVTSRGWIVSEKSAYDCIVGCRHRAWFTALAENSGSGGELSADGGNDVENVKGAAEERRVMRRRGGISGGDRAAVLWSPDLLKIPGVGPRNLRKLVDKGFEGVAELKQLYKEKTASCHLGVCLRCCCSISACWWFWFIYFQRTYCIRSSGVFSYS